jgi:enoyl-CoA hydratase
MTDQEPLVIVDQPAPAVRRITMNRPHKRNAINRPLQDAILAALREGDGDPAVRVQVLRGAGPCFSAGYDLSGDAEYGGESQGDGQWPRRVTEAWTSIWDLAKPVIAQVHGYCLAGGSELATGCDLVYVAADAQIGYPAVRFGVPDMHFHVWFVGMRRAMEMMVTGDAITGIEAAQLGWANRAVPADDLEATVLEVASRIVKIPPDVAQINKRIVHRGMEIMGLRTALRAGTEACALGTHQASLQEFLEEVRQHGLTAALSARDTAFGDYRTTHESSATLPNDQ